MGKRGHIARLLKSAVVKTLQDLMVYLITFMLMIHSYIYLLKRHRLRICQHVNLLLKIVLKILTFGC